MLAVALTVLFLSRQQWVRVGKAMIGRGRTDADRFLRAAGWMLTAGCAGMYVWLLWARVPPAWAAVFVLIGFMVSLLVARIVAETGMPFVRITGLNPHYFMGMLPAGWMTAAVIYMAGFISIVFQLGSRVSATVMACHAAGLDKQATPRQRLRIGYLMIAVLVIGLVVCGAIHLHMSYRHSGTLAGSSPLCAWGSGRMEGPQNMIKAWARDSWTGAGYNRVGHFCFGVGLASVLQWACLAIPKWPLHPIGLLLVGHFYGQTAWASVLIGWSAKMLLLRFGGATAYRRCRPLFMGLVLGEIFAAITWTLVPVILILLGHDPADVGHIPLLPT
jgi:hypothetical protein